MDCPKCNNLMERDYTKPQLESLPPWNYWKCDKCGSGQSI